MDTLTETDRLTSIESCRLQYAAAVITYRLAKRAENWAAAEQASSRALELSKEAYRLVDQSPTGSRSDADGSEDWNREFRDLRAALEAARAWAHKAVESI